MRITASQLRQNIYQILDQVLENGETIEIHRKGKVIKLIPEMRRSKLDNLKKNYFSDEKPESFEAIDWTNEWKENKK